MDESHFILELQSAQTDLFEGRVLCYATFKQKAFFLNVRQFYLFGYFCGQTASFNPLVADLYSFGSIWIVFIFWLLVRFALCPLDDGVESAYRSLFWFVRLVNKIGRHVKHK